MLGIPPDVQRRIKLRRRFRTLKKPVQLWCVKRYLDLRSSGKSRDRALELVGAEAELWLKAGLFADPFRRLSMNQTGDGASKSQQDVSSVYEYVFDNAGNHQAREEDAPSPGAWYLLQAVRESPEMRIVFYRDLWPKLPISAVQLDRVQTSLRDLSRRLDKLQRERQWLP